MNKVYTIKEYMEQGFTETEAYAMRKLDHLQIKWDSLTDEQKNRHQAIAKRLGV